MVSAKRLVIIYKPTVMKTLKRLIIGFLSLIIILIIVWNIGIMIEYNRQLSIGNEYVDNIMTYLQEHKKLPDQLDWKTLEKLNPFAKGKKYDEGIASWPEYRKNGNDHFTLTFLEGFDWPYLTYDSATETWGMK